MRSLDLPEGYWVRCSADVASLIAPNGKIVACYVAGVAPEVIVCDAREDSEKVDAETAHVEHLLESRRRRRA